MRHQSRRWMMAGVIGVAPLLFSSLAARYPRDNGRSQIWPHYSAGMGELALADGARLRPGQYIWRAQPGAGPVRITIDLGRQIAYVYQNSDLVAISTISSGRRGYDTPTGVFPILQKAVWHRSNRYSSAPMPFMQRLTWGGVALHAGGVPGYRQSHGCIHLPLAFARALFGITSIGAIVEVTHGLPMVTPPIERGLTVAARMPDEEEPPIAALSTRAEPPARLPGAPEPMVSLVIASRVAPPAEAQLAVLPTTEQAVQIMASKWL